MNYIVEIENLTISYDQPVLENFCLNIGKGEIVTLIGPSGAGKSSLAREIIRRSKVSKSFDRFIVTGKTGLPRIGYLPQGSHLFGWTTAFGNISFGMSGDAKAPDAADVYRIASTLGLGEDLLCKYPSELSGGEKQRVALARAIIRPADLYILDEPFSELDFRLRFSCYRQIENRLAEGASILLITHDLLEAVLVSDRIMIVGLNTTKMLAEVPVRLERPRDHRALLGDAKIGSILRRIEGYFG